MIWTQTATGRAVDLMQPTADMIDMMIDVPEALARISRFTGHVRSGPYSVAQHCCLMADAILSERNDSTLAAYALLHDAHEAFMGDIATPVAQALALHAEASQEPLPHEFRQRFVTACMAGQKRLKMTLDRVIHDAAGLIWPLPSETYERLIKDYDIRMLATEKRQLMARSPHPWHSEIENADPIRMTGRIGIWPWPKAAEEWRRRAHRLLPAMIIPAKPAEPLRRAGPPTPRTASAT